MNHNEAWRMVLGARDASSESCEGEQVRERFAQNAMFQRKDNIIDAANIDLNWRMCRMSVLGLTCGG
jgi:hypothetical protein